MGVILSESAHTCQAMELAALFVAVYGAEFGEAQRQVAIAAGECFVDFAVVRAVHGLEQILFTLFRSMDGLE